MRYSPKPTTPTRLSSDEAFAGTMGVLGLILGTCAAAFYARGGLTLSHYDAKAHLVVARRILDSLTPGWAQVGAVWLPLPHLLNVFPVQFDALYRTGASAVAISVASLGLACYALARLVLQVTKSRIGASVAVALFALDPNVLYLQATPMTEALLFGLTLLGVDLTLRWVASDATRLPHAAGLVLAAACLTRYEAWAVAAALIVLSATSMMRSGTSLRRALAAAAVLSLYPLVAIALFMIHSRVTIGEWFVTGGFFVPDNPAMGRPLAALGQVAWGLRTLAGDTVVGAALAGVACVAIGGIAWRRRESQLVVLSLLALAALPLYAFYQGHPIRMRYMVAAVSAASLFAGIAVGSVPGRLRVVLGTAAMIGIIMAARPFDQSAPMILEAQWDRPNSIRRRAVTECLASGYQGEPILVSMGALAHYMQELSAEGFEIRDFVHEGNNQFWQRALQKPRGRVGWILMEELAEGGDVLFTQAKASPGFLDGFRRRCEGGGVALYEAVSRERTSRQP